ncbi:MAG: hypothetical protein QW804_03920 [Candidatus Bathyarchaeia archaeon]|nr:hypothetical protein [Candidatus Bathyarchaeota archaeon]
MSKEKRTILSLVFMEKISGFMLLVIGVALAYYANNYIEYLGGIGPFFIMAGVILAILGLLMIISRME